MGRTGIVAMILASGFVALPPIRPGRIAAAEPIETVVHVSNEGSDGGADGSLEKPFFTIGAAYAFIGDVPEAAIELSPGVYSENFPVSFEVSRRLTIRGAPGGEAVIRGNGQDLLLSVTMNGGSSRIAVEGLRFEGGLTGLSVVGADGSEFDVEVVGSRFSGHRYQGIEVVAGDHGVARASIKGNIVDGGAAYGIDLAAGAGGRLELSVTDNRIVDTSAPPVSPWISSRPNRFGLGLYLDIGAWAVGTIGRNAFVNVPVGILVLEEPFDVQPGSVDLLIEECLIAGDRSHERNNLVHGIHLDLWPHFGSSVRIEGSTLVGGDGWGIFQGGPSDWGDRGANASVSIARCIFWNNRLGEFSAEAAGGGLPSMYRVSDSLLPASSLAGSDGNFTSDPLLDEDFVPAAGSPAVDRAVSGDPGLRSDGRGACRPADGDGDGIYRTDIGAIERTGPCLADARPFIRGDSDPNARIELTDGVRICSFLFLGEGRKGCLDAFDSNDDAAVDITDAVYVLGYLFLGTPPPPEPFVLPGLDPTPDALGPCEG